MVSAYQGDFSESKRIVKFSKSAVVNLSRSPELFKTYQSLGLERRGDLDPWKEHEKVIEFYAEKNKQTNPNHQKVQEIPVY